MGKRWIISCLILFLILFNLQFIFADAYVANIYFTIKDTVYSVNERIEIKGQLSLSNYSSNGTFIANSVLSNTNVNITLRNINGSYVSNYTLTTDSNGTFYSKSDYYTNATQMNVSSLNGSYYIRAEYKDPNNYTWFSEVQIKVVNQTIDSLRINSDKSEYNPSETMIIEAEAIRTIGDNILYVSNVSINGSLRNSSHAIIQSFNCVTGTNGKCNSSLTAPSSYGDYLLEIDNFKAFSSFSIVPFSYNLYIKDDLGESYKNVFTKSEQARVEVKINNASDSDSYSFSGYITNSSGVNIKTITLTTLNSNNSFTNSFLIDSLSNFNYGVYTPHVTVSKTGDGSITSTTSFQVHDWMVSLNKKSVGSGFEYEYSSFINKTLKFETIPTYRSNGTVITNISGSSFNINLKDKLNNVINSTNATWNSTCGTNGCYEFSLTAPSVAGEYLLSLTLSLEGDTQTENRIIKIINGVMSAQSTDSDGNIKELFGTNEYVYLSLSTYNSTSASFNLSNAEVFIVENVDGNEYSYSQVDNFSLVNSSNSVYEWAWNSSKQKIKLDVPRIGGVYNVYLFADNRTIGANTKFIVNPHDYCTATKNTAGQVSGTGNYYVWQFKTKDTVYFEIKLTQANNPTGKATAINNSNGSSSYYGMGMACATDSTKQIVANATITIEEVKNSESGALQSVNTTDSTCQSSDSSGGYTCTVKPLSKWEGGQSIVKFKVVGQDGSQSTFYSKFEARAFYLYGWAQTWQNNPSSNISLKIQMYEAGSGWWGGYGSSGGLSGTISVKKIEYQGRDGEWIWPPVDSGYNISLLNSTSIAGNTGTLNLSTAHITGGVWKTGNYRATLQATKSGTGETDYGYAWFSVKLWDVYGSPIECTNASCNYKSYFNSKDNISLYIRITKAGNYDYNGGGNIYGNTSIGVKKISDCKKWPCKDLNSTQYTSNIIYVTNSSPWYWATGLNQTGSSPYMLQINSTTGTWGSGYYSVILNVNGTDTGYAWFNTIAFYVETQPTDANGTNYKYSIRGNQSMFFNVSTTRNYKWWSGSTRYNASDYINATFDSLTLRTWDPITYQQKEYSYPNNINISPLNITGNGLLNVTYKNGTWPTGYYYGELTLKNSDNETSTGWLWFNVQPFRVSASTSSYNIDDNQCVNASLYVYDSDWSSSSVLSGNYSVTTVYENIWSGFGNSIINYTNYTNTSFNGSTTILICPNNNLWGSGSYGGYHYLNMIVKDNVDNSTQTGWLSFKTVPFTITWGNGGVILTTVNVNTSVTLRKPSNSSQAGIGRLTRLYQWRYDNSQSTLEEYVFRAVDNITQASCYSNVSGYCTINGTSNITVYAPSNGWNNGYNYIYADWQSSDGSTTVQDWSTLSVEGRSAYSGEYYYSDLNGNYKYNFAPNQNLTIKLLVKDSNLNSTGVSVSITSLSYYVGDGSCSYESCRTYTALASGDYSPTTTTNGIAILNIKVPTTNWTTGYYYFKVVAGGATISSGGTSIRVKDFNAPNLTIISPVNNRTYNTSILFNSTTNENSNCYFHLINYDNFYTWYCSGITANSSNSTYDNQTLDSCNATKYGFNGTTYYTEWVSNNHHSVYDGANYSYCSSSSGITCYGRVDSGINNYGVTGGLTHTFTSNVGALNLTNQSYGAYIDCYDSDYNSVTQYRALKINNTGV